MCKNLSTGEASINQKLDLKSSEVEWLFEHRIINIDICLGSQTLPQKKIKLWNCIMSITNLEDWLR